MKRRVLLFLLCLTLLVSGIAMTSCSSGDDDETPLEDLTYKSTSNRARTLVLCSITNESTTQEAVELVQAKLNSYTESKFNTHIVLKLLTANEYSQYVEKQVQDIEKRLELKERLANAAKTANNAMNVVGFTTATTVTEETEAVTDQTQIGESGVKEVVYPVPEDDQMDIFLINGYEMYTDFVSRGVLSDLSEQILSGEAKLLSHYINPTMMEAVTLDKKVYAIPNNTLMGEYEFILLRKDLCEKYYYDADRIGSVSDLSSYLQTIKKNEADTIPMISCETIEPPVSYPSGSQSVIGCWLGTDGQTSAPGLLLNNSGFRRYLQFMQESKDLITYADEFDSSVKAGAVLIRGGHDVYEKYGEEYNIVVNKYPMATREVLYDGLYGISVYTSEVSRCMDVVTLLTTNAEFRNAFQYGVEGTHYQRDKDTGIVTMISNDYSMDPRYTGNLFKMWQNSDMSEFEMALSENEWEVAKQTNLDALADPTAVYTLKYETDEVLAEREEARKKAEEEGTEYTEIYTVEQMLAALDELNKKYIPLYEAYEKEYDANGNLVQTYEDYLIYKVLTPLSMEPAVEQILSPTNPYSLFMQFGGSQSTEEA